MRVGYAAGAGPFCLNARIAHHPVWVALLICFVAQPADHQGSREQQVIRGVDQVQARREVNLSGYSVTESYTVHNSRFNIAAEIVIDALFSPGTGKTYRVVSRTGSSVLQTHVLEKLLKEEADMSHGSAWEQSRLISANYKMKLIGEEVVDGRPCELLDLVPKVKSPHVLKGRAWVDGKDYSLVKIEGRTSTIPSFLAGHPTIVREYENVDGFAFARRSHAVSDSLLLGRTELIIEYTGYKLKRHGP